VADVLFGERPFTGRLSMTWPRTEAQVPINIGDADYQPLFPFGWGLRTDSKRGRLLAAVRALGPGDSAARHELDRALARANWTGDTPRSAALAPLGAALAALGGEAPETTAAREAIVSVARDLAQAAVTAGTADADWAQLIAEADHALLTGDSQAAFTLLTRVVG
jgi:beta-glucosidase